jgi:alkanesulfonate monooxygenase SsuD/methylene tetrahydromethanopterin reductase-like flavin-dependent oxidoreductase (luciferase family)
MTLPTTIRLVAPREPVPLAKTLAALDLLSGGRLAEDELALEDVDGPG